MSEAVAIPKSKKRETKPRFVSLEAYFLAEEKSLHKNEYHNGIIIPMAGALLTHNRLAFKAGKLIDNFVEENDLNFIVSNSDTKVRIESYNKVVYPDAVVICETPQYFEGKEHTIINPILIVEVFSDSSKKYDRNTKFEMYRTLSSFKEYVLIHQDRKQVAVFSKQPNGTWILQDYIGDETTAILHHINECPLSLKRLYHGLEL